MNDEWDFPPYNRRRPDILNPVMSNVELGRTKDSGFRAETNAMSGNKNIPMHTTKNMDPV